MTKSLIIIRLYDRTYGENGNPKTLSVYLREDNTIGYSLYGGWQNSGMGFAIGNLQLKESLPMDSRKFKTTNNLHMEIERILRTGVGSHWVKTYEILNEIVDRPKKVVKKKSAVKKQKIVIRIVGGVVEVEDKPKGLTVEIRDYDTDGEFGVIKEDVEGDKYQEIII